MESRSYSRGPLARWTGFLVMAAAAMPVTFAAAGEPTWRIENPSNSGVPGEEVRVVVRELLDGNLWVAARWPFWGQGGIGVYDLDTEVWSVWSNWETPIPSPYINDIEFDQAGDAWIATDAGLVRYDGETWTVYDPTNSPMVRYEVGDLAIAPDGHVWLNNSRFTAGQNAILDFDGVATWIAYRVPDELPWEAPWTDLSAVFVASNGHVWVANDTLSGVAEFDGATWTLRGEALGRLSQMTEDQDGNIWIKGHSVGGDYAFFRWHGEGFTRYPLPSPTALRADPEGGTVYLGNWHGVVQRSRDGGETIEPFLSGLNKVFNFAPDPAGPDVWIGTLGVLGHFRDNGAWVRDYNSYNSGMPWYWVDRMTTDRDGYFWVATGEAGLSRFDGTRWRNWGNHNVGSEEYPFAGNEPMGTAYQDRNGVHWFGGNGIARWHSDTNTFSGFWNWQNNPGMGVGLWTHFAEDAAGTLFATEEYGSTYRFDPEAQRWVREPVQPYAVLGLPGMQADAEGNVWIAAWFDIHKWDGTAWSMIDLPYRDYFFDLGGISGMAIAPDGVLWFAALDGLVRWDGSTFTLYAPDNSPMPFLGLRDIAMRRDGMIGLSAWEGQGAAAVTTIAGDIEDEASWESYLYGEAPLPHWQLGAVGFDPWGDLWISALSEGCAVLEVGPVAVTGDVDGDGVVGIADMLAVLVAWGPCSGCPEDLDGDGRVGFSDLLVVLAHWT